MTQHPAPIRLATAPAVEPLLVEPLHMQRSRLTVLILTCVLTVSTLFVVPREVGADTLPRRLSDRDFWGIINEFSEPIADPSFTVDNFVSNERAYQDVVNELKLRSQRNGVYVGVGPDQNFTYVVAFQPRMAFIVDIRRQNLIQHLLYKAITEMSRNRAEFVSRLFSRPRPRGLNSATPVDKLFAAYANVEGSEALFSTNSKRVERWLLEKHDFPLTPEDLSSLRYVYRAFFVAGPALRYPGPNQPPVPWFPTYEELMLATDQLLVQHGYLANERNYRVLRAMQRSNLLIPIVGDFAGNKALRAVGGYVRKRAAIVNYFYTSNVEQYLFDGDPWRRFYANVASLPLSDNSMFIRSYFDVGFRYPPGIITPDLHSVQQAEPILEVLNAVEQGRISKYQDVVVRPK
jgi:hypothetical protein